MKKKHKILFVCLGNICRSPAAEGVMKALVEEKGVADEWEIDSAGIGGWHVGQQPDRRMLVHARQRGLNLNHRCRQVRATDFEDFDLIIGMDAQNCQDLRMLAPTVEAMDKVQPMSRWLDPAMGYDYVPDPYYEGSEGFELVLDLLQDGCQRLFHGLAHSPGQHQ